MAEKIRLTKTLVDALPFTASTNLRKDYWDSDMGGVCIRVGTKTKTYYLVKFDNETKKTVKVKLGDHPAMLPADARAAALKLLQKTEGIRETKTHESVDTMAKLWSLYLAKHAPAKLKASTQVIYELTWRRHIEPTFGKRDPAKITRAEVRAYFEDYSAISPSTANKFLGVISSMFTFAMKRDLVEFNPASLIEPHPVVRRTRRADKGSFSALAVALDSMPALYSNVYWLLLLLGQRRTETCSMEWADIDFEEKVWTIPGDDILGHKKGRTKNGLTHTVPLPPLALEKIEAMRIHTEEERHVFHCAGLAWNKRGASYINPPSITQFLAKQFAKEGGMAGIPKFSPHDLRRTAFTNMTSLTDDLMLVKRVVNHVQKDLGASAHYDYHHYNDAKRKALLLWEERLRGYIVSEKSVVHVGELEEAEDFAS